MYKVLYICIKIDDLKLVKILVKVIKHLQNGSFSGDFMANRVTRSLKHPNDTLTYTGSKDIKNK